MDEKIYICGVLTGLHFKSVSRPGEKTALRSYEDAKELAMEKAKLAPKNTYYIFKVAGKAGIPEMEPVYTEYNKE